MSLLTGAILSKLAGLGIDQILKPFLASTSDSLTSIAALLKKESERTRVAHLNRAIHYLRQTRTSEAEKEIIDAMSLDDYAAVPRFIEGILLLKMCKTEIGRQYIEEAVQRNPFIIEAFDSSIIPSRIELRSASHSNRIHQWDYSLDDQLITNHVWPKGSIVKRAKFGVSYLLQSGRHSTPYSQIAIVKASFNGEAITVSLIASDNLRHPVFRGIANVSGGLLKWLNECDDILLFSTKRFAVTQSISRMDEINLWDIKNGALVESMNSRYFESMVFPGFGNAPAGFQFSSANIEMDDWQTALRFLSRISDYREPHSIDFGFDHVNVTQPYVDEREISWWNDPYAVTVRNRWEHAHHTASANQFSSCILGSGGSIGWFNFDVQGFRSDTQP